MASIPGGVAGVEAYKHNPAHTSNMYPIGIVAPSREHERAVQDRLVDGLGDDEKVALIHRAASVEQPSDGVALEYTLGEDSWTATGHHRDVETLLRDLAATCDYVLLPGEANQNVPAIVVGDADSPPDPLLVVESAEEVTVERVKEALTDVEPVVTLESLINQVKGSPDADMAGAIATFTGRVRGREHDDDTPTTHLEFEKYAGVASEQLTALERELEDRDGVYAVTMHHRTGVIESGEDIVFVVVLAGHRAEAFETVEDGINRLKAEVPIFKKEVTLDETYWVHNA